MYANFKGYVDNCCLFFDRVEWHLKGVKLHVVTEMQTGHSEVVILGVY